ncbi:flagellar assembly peptidoglycan hydrolase FlgJ [Photobacterium nomapromontoriensis]|uniref:flagellar assembly peptidoglycan hydrolase FlgJ n=1 Tax=Photobacterium nomapromontoriensis TaxID=2910237 RepID=UPI003D0B0E90
MKTTSPGFINDLAGLDRLRAGIGEDEAKSLRAAAQQFEAIFTQMLFKSMRQANEAFESDLMSSSNSKFFEQMHDEQLASELSSTGSLGLADLIVQQLGGAIEPKEKEAKPADPQSTTAKSEGRAADELIVRQIFNDAPLKLPVDATPAAKASEDAYKLMLKQRYLNQQQTLAMGGSAPLTPTSTEQGFGSPKDFVSRLKPYAEKAAQALGTDPSVLIAQAALETGWGQKVIKNAAGSSNNLFNIKADPRWSGAKVATNTLEFHQGIPVQEKAAFRSYDTYQDSFNDYVRFLNDNPRYSKALEHPADPSQFIRNIHQAGYATDPKYVDKIISVMEAVKGYMK